MRALVVVLALIVGAGGTALAGSAGATEPTRTLDRTLLCATSFIGGARSVTARAHRGTGRSGSQWLRPAFAGVTSGQTGSAFTLLDNALAWVTAGRPTRDSTVIQAPVAGVTYPLRSWGTFSWNLRLCRGTSKRIPVSAKGLDGGEIGPFDEGFDCNTPARVRIRMRVTLSGPAALGSYRQFGRITAPLSRAEIAVQTEAGRPLAYAEVLASGKARLLTAKGCTPSR